MEQAKQCVTLVTRESLAAAIYITVTFNNSRIVQHWDCVALHGRRD